MHNDCSFCTNSEIEERMVATNDQVFAFVTHAPIVPGHTLICPKRCVADMDDLDDSERSALERLRQTVARALRDTFGAEGFNYAWNEGGVAGQTVPHIHLHVVPRKEGDAGILQYEPREFLYRPGPREESPHAELQNVAALLREHVTS